MSGATTKEPRSVGSLGPRFETADALLEVCEPRFERARLARSRRRRLLARLAAEELRPPLAALAVTTRQAECELAFGERRKCGFDIGDRCERVEPLGARA